MKCTWVGCDRGAVETVRDKTGKPWAHLCKEHNSEMDSCIVAGDAKGTLRSWVRASGGAKKLAERI
jgi:hypothetical protein